MLFRRPKQLVLPRTSEADRDDTAPQPDPQQAIHEALLRGGRRGLEVVRDPYGRL
jgi:hypothetical protein